MSKKKEIDAILIEQFTDPDLKNKVGEVEIDAIRRAPGEVIDIAVKGGYRVHIPAKPFRAGYLVALVKDYDRAVYNHGMSRISRAENKMLLEACGGLYDLLKLRRRLADKCNIHFPDDLTVREILDCLKEPTAHLKPNAEIVIDGASRMISIEGVQSFFITGENQWDFIKDIVCASKSAECVPHGKESKSSYDGIRNSLKKTYGKMGVEILKRLVVSDKRGGYRLGDIKTGNFSQVGIRPTYQKGEDHDVGDFKKTPER